MGFLALVNAYTMRITLSVAITEMVIRVNNTHEDSDTCPDLDAEGGSGVSSIETLWFSIEKLLNLDCID